MSSSADSSNVPILCTVQVSIDRNPSERQISCSFQWPKNGTFQDLDDRVTEEFKGGINATSSKLLLRAGRCRELHVETTIRGFYCFSSPQAWHEAVGNLVTRSNPISQAPLRLDVRLDYLTIQTEPTFGLSYTETLRNELHRHMQNNYEGRRYSTLANFDWLREAQSLERLVREDGLFGHGSNEFLQSSTKLLAICLSAGLPLSLLQILVEVGISDACLPLSLEQCPDCIAPDNFKTLLSEQWKFSPYQFCNPAALDRVNAELILPVYFDQQKDVIGRGSYCTVYKVYIDEICHQFPTTEENRFALKRCDNSGASAEHYNQELSVLNMIARQAGSAPHLISHLAAWEQSGGRFLLLPIAKSNLRSFMTRPKPMLEPSFIVWFLRQLHGLAAGVELMHCLTHKSFEQPSLNNSKGEPQSILHLDIRPENIFVFDHDAVDENTFVISDFGSAKIKPLRIDRDDDLSANMDTAGTTLTYGGPDFYLEGRVSRPYDMWALGCTFLELLSWIYLGPVQGVEEFADARLQACGNLQSRVDAFWMENTTYSYLGVRRARLNPAVERRLDQLELLCTGPFTYVLASIRKLLRVRPTDRITAKSLEVETNRAYDQARLFHYAIDTEPYLESKAP